MRLPTAIPDDLHLDLTEPGQITVTRAQDAMIQRAMIICHRSLLGQGTTDLQAARHWIESGLALAYRRHYRVI